MHPVPLGATVLGLVGQGVVEAGVAHQRREQWLDRQKRSQYVEDPRGLAHHLSLTVTPGASPPSVDRPVGCWSSGSAAAGTDAWSKA